MEKKLTQEQKESDWKDRQRSNMIYRWSLKSHVLDHFENTQTPSEPYIGSFQSNPCKGLGINWKKLTQEILDEEFLPLGIQAKIIYSGWLGFVDIEFRKI